MAANLKEIEQQARTLSADERASLAESLLESLRVNQVAEVEAAHRFVSQARYSAVTLYVRRERKSWPRETIEPAQDRARAGEERQAHLSTHQAVTTEIGSVERFC